MNTSESRHPHENGGSHTMSIVGANGAIVLDREAPLRQWAMAYAEAGLAVLPLVPGTKRPITKRGLLDATVDHDLIRCWWSRTPEANIGLATGFHVDVADFDVRVREGGVVEYTSAPALEALNDRAALAGCVGVSRTRHGGLQFLFPARDQRIRHADKLHLDLLGTGAYIVAPPSRVAPDPGMVGPGRYSWLQPLDLRRDGAAPVNFTTWMRWLGQERRSTTALRSRRGRHCSVRGLVRFVAHARPGGRNNAAFWALCKALARGTDPAPIIEAALSTGLSDSEVRSILASAQRTVGGRHV